MSPVEIPDPPIYERLVRERGDVLTASREVAEQTQRRARQVLDVAHSPSPGPGPERGESRAFSAFGLPAGSPDRPAPRALEEDSPADPVRE